jgi:hypothetical protein
VKNKLGSAKSRWKQMKKGSMKKLTSLTNRLNLNKGSNPGWAFFVLSYLLLGGIRELWVPIKVILFVFVSN